MQRRGVIVAADGELSLEELAALDHAVAVLDGVANGLTAAGKAFAAEEVYVTRDVIRRLLERDHDARETNLDPAYPVRRGWGIRAHDHRPC